MLINLGLEKHEIFADHIELDESYLFGSHQGKRGRGTIGKTAVFGILKCGGKIYTKGVYDAKGSTLYHHC